MNNKQYVIDYDVITKLKFMCNKLTFGESKELFGKDGGSDEQHMARMSAVEADLAFLNTMSAIFGTKVFTISEIKETIENSFEFYEKVHKKKPPVSVREHGKEVLERCIKIKALREVVKR